MLIPACFKLHPNGREAEIQHAIHMDSVIEQALYLNATSQPLGDRSFQLPIQTIMTTSSIFQAQGSNEEHFMTIGFLTDAKPEDRPCLLLWSSSSPLAKTLPAAARRDMSRSEAKLSAVPNTASRSPF
jgi:hypothetical protein